MPVSPETLEIAYKALAEQGLLWPVILSSLTAVFGAIPVADWLSKRNGKNKK